MLLYTNLNGIGGGGGHKTFCFSYLCDNRENLWARDLVPALGALMPDDNGNGGVWWGSVLVLL